MTIRNDTDRLELPDAPSISGLGLYESLGFTVKARGSTWRKAW